MLEAPGGGGGTDWATMPMELIQGLAQSPNIDLHYKIVDGWQKSADLIGEHLFQVQQYRDALAGAWSPAKSSAAKVYLDRLDTLIGHLQETQNAALSNYEAMSSASLSLSLAQTEMNKIYSQWDSNNNTLLAFNQQQAQKKAQIQTGKPMPSPGPSGDEPPPVTADQQEALRQKAVTLMSGVSTDLAQAQLKIVRPAPYVPDLDVQKGTHGEGSGIGSAPVVPPIVPTPYAGGGRSSYASSSAHNSVAFPSTSGNTPLPKGSVVPNTTSSNPGLVLGGTNPPSPLPSPPTTSPIPITPSPTGSGPMGNPSALPPATGPLFPTGDVPPGGGKLPEASGALKSFGVPERGFTAMPPGGMIGFTQGGGLGGPGKGGFGTQHINPVGGVIGEPGAGGGMAGRSAAAGVGRSRGVGNITQPAYGAGSRRTGPRNHAADARWDPDNPWATEAGVDPVLLPPTEQQINPGPAIGLG